MDNRPIGVLDSGLGGLTSVHPHYAFQNGFQLEKPLCRAPRSWVLVPAL